MNNEICRLAAAIITEMTADEICETVLRLDDETVMLMLGAMNARFNGEIPW